MPELHSASTPEPTHIGGRTFAWGSRTFIMAALNVTPDSFSGDGVMASHGASDWVQLAVDLALRAEDQGADIIDIGGESTRPASVYPGARPVPADEEAARVLPVITALRGRLSAPISIDTRKASIAAAALKAGAAMINDVSMLGDPAMAGVAAAGQAPIVISHIRPKAEYASVVVDVTGDLSAAVGQAVAAGVLRGSIIIDPGIGFAKKAEHSLELLRGLSGLRALGSPILVGTSRKSFIGAVLDLDVSERLEGTAATVALAIAGGADIVRVHDVLPMVRVARMADAIVRGWPRP
jgi:dihydropteroate synthase